MRRVHSGGRLPKGWAWSDGRWPNVICCATDGRTRVMRRWDGVIAILGGDNEAPTAVVLAVLTGVPDDT